MTEVAQPGENSRSCGKRQLELFKFGRYLRGENRTCRNGCALRRDKPVARKKTECYAERTKGEFKLLPR
jgi:hypothetical protein